MSTLIRISLIVVAGTVAVFVIGFAVKHIMRRTKKRPHSFGGIAWALLFFSSGRMPPPPQTQIEQETREKKNREVGRDVSDPK